MESSAIIISDTTLDRLLSKISLKAKKSFLLYFLTTPKLIQKFSTIFLPESILQDTDFATNIINYIKNEQVNIGISLNTQFAKNGEDIPLTQDYISNPLPIILQYKQQYSDINSFHIVLPFGKRRIQKSPKHDEYVVQSHYNWTTLATIAQVMQNMNIELIAELDVYFYENSSEDYYIHMRQILWDGQDLFKKLGLKLPTLLVNPFYPKLKGLRNPDVLDPANIANTTLRCLMESLQKPPTIWIKSCEDMGPYAYAKYIKFITTYRKEGQLQIRFTIGGEMMGEFINIWMGNTNNMEEARKKVSDGLVGFF